MKTPLHSPIYWPHIDGLRAIAVLAVMLYHLDPEVLPGGFAGVDVFFVISGFVVTTSALSRGHPSPGAFLGDFLSRRFRRLLPALIVCLLVTSLASALWIPASWLSDSIPRTGRLAFFGLSNVALARDSNDYFSPVAAFNPFTHTWSLAVEEQFYVLAPLLLWGWIRGGRWRIGAAMVLIAAAVASYAYAWEASKGQGGAAYYLLATRFWELAAGVILGWALGVRSTPSPRRERAEFFETWAPPIALLALVFGFTASRPETFPAHGAWLPVVATMILLAGLHHASDRRWVNRLLAAAPLRRIGRLSYSLYLWHWPVIVLFRWTVGLHGPLRMALAITMSFAFAWVSWRIVEQPFRHALRAYSPRRIILPGVLALLAGALVAQALQKQQHRISPSKVANARSDWYPSRAQKLTSPEGCSVSPQRSDLARGWYQTFERVGCATVPSAPRIFAAGDSHALAYGPLFARYAMETGGTVTVYNNGGCPLLSLQPWREESGQCPDNISVALDNMLPRLRPGDVVFLPSLRLPRYVEQGWVMSEASVESMIMGRDAREARAAAAEAAMDLLRRLRRSGARVVIQAPNIVLKAPAFRCADWWTKGNPICAGGVSIARKEFLSMRAPVLDALRALANTDDGVVIFDPVPSLCPAAHTCEGIREGRPLFFDGDHLSAHGNQVVYPAFLAAIRALGGSGGFPMSPVSSRP
jgi:peptidoglycan/LPS O-acetylase OafA/YrhL